MARKLLVVVCSLQCRTGIPCYGYVPTPVSSEKLIKWTGNQQQETTFALLNTIGKAIQHQGYLMTSWAFDLAALLLDEEANTYTTS
jgi:hypothetical protein